MVFLTLWENRGRGKKLGKGEREERREERKEEREEEIREQKTRLSGYC